MFRKHLALGFILMLGAVSHCQAQAKPDGVERFLDVKVWRLRVTWSYGEQAQTADTSRKVNLSANITYKLVKSKDTSPAIYQWIPDKTFKPTGEFLVSSEWKVGSGANWMRYVYSGGGIDEGAARISMESADLTFRMFAYVTSPDGTLDVTNSAGAHARSNPSVNLSIAGVGKEWIGHLPAGGLVVSGSRGDVPCYAPLTTGQPMTVKWTLEPWEDEDPTEATFKMVDKDWWPYPDQPCSIEVSWKGDAEKVRVTLDGISHEPGTCLNSDSKGDEDDLKIENQGRWLIEHTGSGGDSKYVAVQVLPKEAKPPLVLDIKATDFGAWGSLRCEVLLNDKWKDAKEASGKTSMEIPEGSGEDHIARSWKKKYGVEDQRADSDKDEEPKGDGRTGDGLTLYEEYRGFMVKGEHITTNPKEKDLFLSDQSGTATFESGDANTLANDGIVRFETITKIKVHKVTQSELGEDRIVNRNHKEGAHKVDQHGVPIVRGAAGSDAEAIATSDSAPFGPPVLTKYVTLPTGGRWRTESPSSKNSMLDQALEDKISTVAHELCHAVGVQHHGGGVSFAVWKWKKDPDGVTRLYEQGFTSPAFADKKGAPMAIRAFRESDGTELEAGSDLPGQLDATLGGNKLMISVKSGESSGAEACVMRYLDGEAYRSDRAPGVYFVPDPAQWVKRAILCDTKQGSTFNAAGHSPQPRYGDAPRGECKNQIVVSDAYAGK
jgi:hypothetical protein